MADVDGDPLASELESIAGDALRSVATYDEDGYDVWYVRDGLADRADEIAADLYQNLVQEDVGRGYLEELFGAGDLRCTLHEFEQLRAYHFVAGQIEGIFVSVDTGASVENAVIRAVVSDHVDG